MMREKKAYLLYGLLATSSIVFQADAAFAQQRKFNLTAGNANSTIPLFARQGGIQIIAPAKRLQGVRTPRIVGNIDTRVALKQLLQSTNLVVAADNGSIVVLKEQPPRPVQRAAFQASVPADVPVTEDGTPAPAPRLAAPQAEPAVPEVGNDIIVTGTRRTDRTVAESAVPVDVFDSSALQAQAPSDMNNVLRNLILSFNVSRLPLSDGSSFVRPPTLRGLPPDEILVLVNGKRRHRAALVQIFGGSLAAGSQGVDLAQIPVIAIERIEVLRDGAAAQYGSDAIAGVINYGLKRNREGISATARYGQYYRGDGENTQLAVNVGLPLAEGFISASAEFADSNITAPGGQRAGAAALQMAFPDLDIANPANAIGDPKSRSYRGFVNAGLPVSDDSEVYLYGNYGETRTQITQNYRQPVTVTGPDKFGTGTASYPFTKGVFETLYLDRLPNGNYDSTGATYNFNQLYPAGFSPRFKGHITDLSLTGGYKGKTSFDVNYDLSASYGQNRIDYNISNTINPSMGPESQTAFYLGRLEQRELNFNADFSYAWEIGLASPLTVAVGGERRREAYAIEAGEPGSYEVGPYFFQVVQRPDNSTFTVAEQIGANGFPGFGTNSAVDKARTSYAVYLDVEGDIVDGLSLGGAVRHENFSDFGTTTNVKGTLRYAFNDAIAFRAAASTGFRAPTPGQLYTTNIASGFVGANPVETATLPPSNVASQYFGAKTLGPEKAKNYSVGLVLTPSSLLTVTVDAYRIDVNDRIGLSGDYLIDDAPNETQIRADLRALGVQNFATLGRVRYFTNGFATRTQGVDFVLNHNMSTDFGRFGTTLAANYNKTDLRSFEPGVLTRERIGNIENLIPKVRGSLTETWSMDAFSVIARGSYFGSFKDFALPADGGDKGFGSELQFDLELAYQATDNIRVAVGAENIFNNYPDKNFRAAGLPNQNFYTFTNAIVGGNRYPGDSPLGINGGFWYVRAGLNF